MNKDKCKVWLTDEDVNSSSGKPSPLLYMNWIKCCKQMTTMGNQWHKKIDNEVD